jgi:hypothetical protein
MSRIIRAEFADCTTFSTTGILGDTPRSAAGVQHLFSEALGMCLQPVIPSSSLTYQDEQCHLDGRNAEAKHGGRVPLMTGSSSMVDGKLE